MDPENKPKHFIEFKLQDLSCEKISYTLWNDLALKLHNFIMKDATLKEPIIMPIVMAKWYRICNNGQNKDKSGQNQARDWKERENTRNDNNPESLLYYTAMIRALKDSSNEPPLRIYQRWKNGIYEEALRKSDQMHQTYEKSSLAMTHKLDDIMNCLNDEPIRDLNMMEDKVDNPSPQSTLQVLPSFEEVGLNCNHNAHLSYREDRSFDNPEPQPQPLPNCPPLDASLGTKRGFKPPIKPQSLDSFRMKVLDNLTIHTPPSSLVVSFHLKDLYCYYRPCVDDPKKHYGFKPGLLGHSGSLGVDFSKLGMIGDDWKLEYEEVSLLERGLNSPVRPKYAEKVRINETYHLEQVIFDEKKLGSS
ncbi:hypothetical protein Tco_0271946 [Tanacetum coccineum]